MKCVLKICNVKIISSHRIANKFVVKKVVDVKSGDILLCEVEKVIKRADR